MQQQNQNNNTPRHGSASGRPQRSGVEGQAPRRPPSGAAGGYTRRPQPDGVPGQDAFSNLPKRRPPDHLPGQPPMQQTQGMPVAVPPARGGQKRTGQTGQSAGDGHGQRRHAGQADPQKAKEAAEREARKQEARQRRRKKRESVSPAKRRRNRRIIAMAAVALLIVVGLGFTFSVLFKIERFALQGESPYTQEEIIAVFGRGPGDGMFGFSASGAETRIEQQLPYIEEVTIRRRLPGTVVFRVTPAQEAYAIPFGDSWAVLSTQRKVLKLEGAPPEGLTAIFGVTGVTVEPGKALAAGEVGNGFPYSYEEYVAMTAPPPEPEPVPEGEPTEEELAAQAAAEAEAAALTEGQPEGEAPAEGEVPAEGAAQDDVAMAAVGEPPLGEAAQPEGETPAEGEGVAAEGEALTEDTGAVEGDGTVTSEPGAEEGAGSEPLPEEVLEEPAEAAPPEPTDLEMLASLLRTLSASGLENINWIDVSDPLDLRFRWEDRITVRLGARSNLTEKMRFVTVLLADPEKSQVTAGDRGVLDVSGYPDTTDRVWLTPE